jgi:hypothetical protein
MAYSPPIRLLLALTLGDQKSSPPTSSPLHFFSSNNDQIQAGKDKTLSFAPPDQALQYLRWVALSA